MQTNCMRIIIISIFAVILSIAGCASSLPHLSPALNNPLKSKINSGQGGVIFSITDNNTSLDEMGSVYLTRVADLSNRALKPRQSEVKALSISTQHTRFYAASLQPGYYTISRIWSRYANDHGYATVSFGGASSYGTVSFWTVPRAIRWVFKVEENTATDLGRLIFSNTTGNLSTLLRSQKHPENVYRNIFSPIAWNKYNNWKTPLSEDEKIREELILGAAIGSYSPTLSSSGAIAIGHRIGQFRIRTAHKKPWKKYNTGTLETIQKLAVTEEGVFIVGGDSGYLGLVHLSGNLEKVKRGPIPYSNVVYLDSNSSLGVVVGVLHQDNILFFKTRSILMPNWEPIPTPNLSKIRTSNDTPHFFIESINGNIVIAYDKNKLAVFDINNQHWTKRILPNKFLNMSVYSQNRLVIQSQSSFSKKLGFYSDDLGESWGEFNVGRGLEKTHFVDTDTAYMIWGSQLRFSTDGGENLDVLANRIGNASTLHVFNQGDIIFISSDQWLRESIDGGFTWRIAYNSINFDEP